ncbi:MAG: S53 family peptidase [Acidobacteriaceae bacterium]
MQFRSLLRNRLAALSLDGGWWRRTPLRAIRVVSSAAILAAALAGVHAPAQAGQASLAGLQPVQQADRVARNPDFSSLLTLSQRLPEWDRVENTMGGRGVDLSQTLHLAVVLSRDPAAQAAFEQFRAAQQNPQSPYYHRWLKPQQVGQLFGPTANDRAAVISWLTSQGLTVDSVDPNGLIIRATGSLVLVGDAFHTSFQNFEVAGQQRVAAVSQPMIPSALSAVILSVHGLAEVHYAPQSNFTVRMLSPTAGSSHSGAQADLGGGVYAILPKDFATIYDIASVYSSGDEGATIGSSGTAGSSSAGRVQRIAILGKSRIVASDIASYEAIAGLPSVQPNVILAGSDPGVATGANVGFASEATLDVERVIGTAPAAQADLVISADAASEDGVEIALAYNINSLLDPVMNISFGACESESGSAETDYLQQEFEAAASEGISTFVSADDTGAAGCDTAFAPAPAIQAASINVFCSSGDVTCVGGTEFNDLLTPSLYWSASNSAGYESALSYIPEGAWNEPTTVDSQGQTVYQVAEGGGGASAFISKPAWQSGAGVPNDGFRDVPDVAFTAAEHDGYLGCFAAGGASCQTTNQGTAVSIFFGTSAAAPGMAGVAALLNTKMGAAQGNLNPMLYGLAASNQGVFHDVTVASSGVTDCTIAEPSMCNNSTPDVSSLTGGLAGFSVGPGYDQATGLGSVDVAKLLSAAVSGDATGGSFTLAANPSALSVAPQASATSTTTWTLTATALQSFAGTVALSCAVTPLTSHPPMCSVSPSTLSLNQAGSQTATVSLVAQGSSGGCLAQAMSAEPRQFGRTEGVALAGLLLLCLPIRRRRSRWQDALRRLRLVCLLGVGLGCLSGCGGSVGGSSCSAASAGGTTAGNYTVTVTGTSGSLSVSAPLSFTVN